ncbi:YbaB/EbfC family nucleoid-associated protein [Micromonospora sp. WMMD1082]|uniref:YbaB/EbfC family nucleoid-associated protein n=1 Tax=Micromonospora sp. WMMD1082 TaxID=3016104 RepID=UPI002415A06C|nr:YbaB/EbfC family nucleoid-associated protein [Micromonospora sp. WMMD1082]MDG4795734.1 YbaB/EbfC family nucleoid-associated protein [Micromonospora sp. WMMD1082]
MTTPLHNQIEQAYAEFSRQREALSALAAESERAETTVTSKNRAISVTVNGRAAVTSIRFPISAYRTMPAAELGNLIVETIEAARTQAANEAMERYRSSLPEALSDMDPHNGGLDVEAMFSRAARMMNDDRLGDLLNGQRGGGRHE